MSRPAAMVHGWSTCHLVHESEPGTWDQLGKLSTGVHWGSSGVMGYRSVPVARVQWVWSDAKAGLKPRSMVVSLTLGQDCTLGP